jgi:hypothetical protein
MGRSNFSHFLIFRSTLYAVDQTGLHLVATHHRQTSLSLSTCHFVLAVTAHSCDQSSRRPRPPPHRPRSGPTPHEHLPPGNPEHIHKRLPGFPTPFLPSILNSSSSRTAHPLPHIPPRHPPQPSDSHEMSPTTRSGTRLAKVEEEAERKKVEGWRGSERGSEPTPPRPRRLRGIKRPGRASRARARLGSAISTGWERKLEWPRRCRPRR